VARDRKLLCNSNLDQCPPHNWSPVAKLNGFVQFCLDAGGIDLDGWNSREVNKATLVDAEVHPNPPTMKKLIIFTSLVLTTASVFAGPDLEERDFKSVDGPATVKLGSVAELQIPVGYSFIDGETLQKLMRAVGQPTSEDLVGSVGPTNADWSVMFHYEAIGFVKDDDKDSLDADKILQDYREGTEEANKHRTKSGFPPIHVVGWQTPPHYNSETHNLEWAIQGNSEGEDILNYDTRLLGRRGMMSVKLIVAPDEFGAALPLFTNLMTGFSFKSGETYAEYKPGDKIAKLGLGALIVGGAAVGAAKLGLFAWVAVLFKKFFKFIIIAIAAVAATFKKIFAAIFNRKRDS